MTLWSHRLRHSWNRRTRTDRVGGPSGPTCRPVQAVFGTALSRLRGGTGKCVLPIEVAYPEVFRVSDTYNNIPQRVKCISELDCQDWLLETFKKFIATEQTIRLDSYAVPGTSLSVPPLGVRARWMSPA